MAEKESAEVGKSNFLVTDLILFVEAVRHKIVCQTPNAKAPSYR